jgi:protein-histidine N-methyltransferase
MNKQLGAGTAVPSLTLFARLLSQAEPGQSQRKTLFTFADYNSDVLRLVTLPNLLLTWHNCRSQMAVSAGSTAPDQDEELDITPELVQEFKDDLAQRGISVDFVSGAWSPEFADLVFSSGEGARETLVLASETIYSPASLAAFSETLLALLRRSNTASVKSRALVAAKKVYFGVGGGVDEFLAVLGNVCANELDVQQKLNVQSEGVGRVVLEVVPSSGP